MSLNPNVPPSPDEEIAELDRIASHKRNINREVFFATTQYVGHLTPGRSEVVLFGDENFNHKTLAKGTFISFIEHGSKEYEKILNSFELYQHKNIPWTASGFIQVHKFTEMYSDLNNLDAWSFNGHITTSEVSKIWYDDNDPYGGTDRASIYFMYHRQFDQALPEQDRVDISRHQLIDRNQKIKQLSGLLTQESKNRQSTEEVFQEMFDKIESERDSMALIRKLFDNINFLRGSQTILAQGDIDKQVFEALFEIQFYNRPINQRWKIVPFEGTHFMEISFQKRSEFRIYYLKSSEGKVPVLVSSKEMQKIRQDKSYLSGYTKEKMVSKRKINAK